MRWRRLNGLHKVVKAGAGLGTKLCGSTPPEDVSTHGYDTKVPHDSRAGAGIGDQSEDRLIPSRGTPEKDHGAIDEPFLEGGKHILMQVECKVSSQSRVRTTSCIVLFLVKPVEIHLPTSQGQLIEA